MSLLTLSEKFASFPENFAFDAEIFLRDGRERAELALGHLAAAAAAQAQELWRGVVPPASHVSHWEFGGKMARCVAGDPKVKPPLSQGDIQIISASHNLPIK